MSFYKNKNISFKQLLKYFAFVLQALTSPLSAYDCLLDHSPEKNGFCI